MIFQKSVFVIIPAYNRKLVTLDCLENLKQNGDLTQYQVVVVNDGSTDGTGQAINQLFPEVIVLQGDGNLWWTGAIAIGMEYAMHQGAEYIIWLNDDCTPESNALKILVDFCQTHPNTISGAACYLTESNQLHETGARGRKRMAAKPGEVVHVDEMSGHCVCFPGKVVDQIELPDIKRFPHYHGDSTYILKATRAGFSAYIVGDACFRHSGLIKSTIQDFLNTSNTKKRYIESFKKLFIQKKSLYYLPTQFFYYLEKYGVVKGISIFLVKTVSWFVQFIQIHLSQSAGKCDSAME